MIDAATRRLVRERAGHRCEYCGVLQAQQSFPFFHVDHIIALQHGGTDDPANLALSCYHCNLHKGANLTGIDPETGAVTVLFHPRREVWETHFALRDARMVGLTPTGRTTVRVLDMNAADRMQLRRALQEEPPVPPY
jgi:HNH endonuclease